MSGIKRPDRQKPGQQFWIGHVQNHRKSRFSQVEYCRENKLKLSAFRYWARKLKQAAEHGRPGKQASQSNCSDLVEVTSVLSALGRRSVSVQPVLEIELGQQCRIRVPPNWEADDLKKILGLLKELVC